MAIKATTCKEAIAMWEKEKGENATEAKVIEMQFRWPPIEKMDGALSTLTACEKLSLSSNMIDKIAGIAGMRNLKILSLGRNYIKSLAGIRSWYLAGRLYLVLELQNVLLNLRSAKIDLVETNQKQAQSIFITCIETVADSLEELWISYNLLDKLKGIGSMKNLKVFYAANNLIKEWVEFNRLQECQNLRDLVFTGNPICDNQPDLETWRNQASNRLPQINKLDGIPIIRDTD